MSNVLPMLGPQTVSVHACDTEAGDDHTEGAVSGLSLAAPQLTSCRSRGEVRHTR